MIELKNINLTGISIGEQVKKVNEELEELSNATCDYMIEETEENKSHVIEEYFDLLQSALGMLDKLGIKADEVMRHYSEHEEKLQSRPRKK
jgi:phosphoribosyl-ATP pyrophosphohydrolase